MSLKKFFGLVLGLIFLVSNAFAEGFIVDAKGIKNTSPDLFAKQDKDGNYIALAWTTVGEEKADIIDNIPKTSTSFITKIDKKGNILWKKEIFSAPTDEFIDLLVTKENNYLFVGTRGGFEQEKYNAFAIMMDKNGNVLWEKQYGDWNKNIFTFFGNVLEIDDSFIYMGTYKTSLSYDDRFVFIMKTDKQGDVHFFKIIKDSYYDYYGIGESIQKNANNDILFVFNNKFIKFDKNFNFQLGKQFPFINHDYSHSFLNENGEVLTVFSNNKVAKFDINGNIQWQKSISYGSGFWAHKIIQTSDGGFVIGGIVNNKKFLIKFSSNNSLLWAKEINLESLSAHFIETLMETTDKGLLIATSGGYLIKLDKDGNIESPLECSKIYDVTDKIIVFDNSISNNDIKNINNITMSDFSIDSKNLYYPLKTIEFEEEEAICGGNIEPQEPLLTVYIRDFCSGDLMYDLTAGKVTSTDGYINCGLGGMDCQKYYYGGGNTTLNLTVGDGYTFLGWFDYDYFQCGKNMTCQADVGYDNGDFKHVLAIPYFIKNNRISNITGNNFSIHEAVPVASCDNPIGVGTSANGTNWLDLNIKTPPFTEPMDIYLGAYAPALYPNSIYLIENGGKISLFNGELVKYKENVTSQLFEFPFGEFINVQNDGSKGIQLPSGEYHFYLLIMPAGSNFDRGYKLYETVLNIS